MKIDEIQSFAVNVFDSIGVSLVIATIMQWAPPATAILTLIWAGLRIYQIRLDIKAKKKALKGIK